MDPNDAQNCTLPVCTMYMRQSPLVKANLHLFKRDHDEWFVRLKNKIILYQIYIGTQVTLESRSLPSPRDLRRAANPETGLFIAFVPILRFLLIAPPFVFLFLFLLPLFSLSSPSSLIFLNSIESLDLCFLLFTFGDVTTEFIQILSALSVISATTPPLRGVTEAQ